MRHCTSSCDSIYYADGLTLYRGLNDRPPSSSDLDSNAFAIRLGIRHESVGGHIDITAIRLEQLPIAVLAVILLAAEPAPQLGEQQIDFGVRELHPETLSGTLRERHQVALEAWVLDEAFRAVFHRVVENIGVVVDQWRGHADGRLEEARSVRIKYRETRKFW